MPKRKKDRFDEEWTRFDKELTRFLRYTIFEDEIEKRYRVWGGARLVDVACKLGVEEEDVWRAVETSTHSTKGRRYWWEDYHQDIWVGVNWWPDKAGETSLWPPLGGQYFRCPNEWARKEGEGLVEYIRRWFVWEKGCLSDDIVREWDRTAMVVERLAHRGRKMTFHAGPSKHCPPSMKSIDVANKYNIKGVPSGVQALLVTGVDKECVKHLMKQADVARAVRDIVILAEARTSGDEEVAVRCQFGKHRSVGVVMITVACVYFNAVVAFHNQRAFEVAREKLELSVRAS